MKELFAHGLRPALRHSSEIAEVLQVPQNPWLRQLLFCSSSVYGQTSTS